MRDSLNKQIVDTLKNSIKPDDNLVDMVMNTLSLGKEAAYRRIRGEVPFAFSEIAKLASTFRFSLDSIIGVSFPDIAVINTRFFDASQIYEDYKQTLESFLAILREMNRSTKAKLCVAFNIIPFTFYAQFEALSKFKLYRWMHQMDVASNSSTSFVEMKLPDDVWALQQEVIRETEALQEICYVLDRNIFSTFVNDINHFIQLGFISTEDCRILKNELLAVLDMFERLVKEGGATPQNQVSVYISNIDFDSSYSYYEADELTFSSMRVFAVNTLNTQDAHFFKTQKKWIESLKRYSVLISGCGEMERVKFITKQRDIINLL